MRRTLLMLTPLVLASAAHAQNSDLGFLVGFSQQSTVGVGRVTSSVHSEFQINYAWQLREGPAGRLYIEAPIAFTGANSARVDSVVTSSAGGNVYFTPGVRYHYALTSRVAVYGAAGAGLAAAKLNYASVAPGAIRSGVEWHVSFAGDLGVGVDFRLTRLLSLRAEGRDYLATRSAGLGSRSNASIQGGLAFHF